MNDLISKKRIMAHIESQHRQWGDDYDALQILGDIEDAPTIKAELVKHGKWIIQNGGCWCGVKKMNDKPTEKQIAYAKELARRMCQKLPDEFSKQAYSDFISKWKPVVKREDEAMNEPTAWQLKYYQ